MKKKTNMNIIMKRKMSRIGVHGAVRISYETNHEKYQRSASVLMSVR
jgi:hypothetical protein